MSQILDAPKDTDASILCGYRNCTRSVQIARIANVPGWYFERVVFPGQQLLFYAIAEAELEIHSSQPPSQLLDRRIACSRLQVGAAN